MLFVTGTKYVCTDASMFSSEYSTRDATKLLQSESLDVWNFHPKTVELCTVMTNKELEYHYNLHNCTAGKQLVDLINLENVQRRYRISQMQSCT